MGPPAPICATADHVQSLGVVRAQLAGRRKTAIGILAPRSVLLYDIRVEVAKEQPPAEAGG